MKRHSAAAAVLCLSAGLALAASPAIEAAVKSLAAIEADTTKLQGYCKVLKDMDAAGDDEAKLDALDQQMRDLLQGFGPQFEQVLELSESTDSESADGKVLDEAFGKLDQKCRS